MQLDFWQRRWEKNEIAFHEGMPNSLLIAHFKKLRLAKGDRIFIPLCGKTLDIAWLLSEGHRVVGAEFSQLAIEQLFSDLGVEPKITNNGRVSHYSAHNVDIFVGDIFDLTQEDIGSIDATYDRAALVALPEEMRTKYVKHLLEITDTAEQLLITFEYDQEKMEGPPFSLSSDAVNQYYHDKYQLTLIDSVPVAGKLKGIVEACEHIWYLRSLEI